MSLNGYKERAKVAVVAKRKYCSTPVGSYIVDGRTDSWHSFALQPLKPCVACRALYFGANIRVLESSMVILSFIAAADRVMGHAARLSTRSLTV